jgi:arabinose-5-phosphate isomerase
MAKDLIAEIIQGEAEAIRAIPKGNPYTKTVDAFHKAVRGHGTVVVSGVGKAGDIGRKISSTLNSIGMRSVFVHPLEAAHGDLGGIHKNSAVLLLSNSGKTRELLEFTSLIKNLYPKAAIAVITGHPNSPIGKVADFVLSTGNPKEVEPMNLVPTTSCVAMLVIGDILTVLSMKKLKLTPAKYQKHHHGGYIGKQAKKLSNKN